MTELVGTEQHFGENEIIVSKTDLKGRIVYANDIFLRISGYTEDEVLNQPHSMIRHPYMPRCIFKLLWEQIAAKSEVFAYVVNRCKNGDYYWVLAHVTPTLDASGNIIGYHSNRRVPDAAVIRKIKSLYQQLNDLEAKSNRSREGMLKAFKHLEDLYAEHDISYNEFVFSLNKAA